MYYERIFKTLNKHNVKYLVAGGMAVNLHGLPRFTKDVDILIDQSKENLDKLTKAILEIGYKPKAPISLEEILKPDNWIKWNKEKGLLAVNFYNPKKPFEELDLLVFSPVNFQEAYTKRVHLESEGIALDLASLDDLIKMKEGTGRQQDTSDIKALKKLKSKLEEQ